MCKVSGQSRVCIFTCNSAVSIGPPCALFIVISIARWHLCSHHGCQLLGYDCGTEVMSCCTLLNSIDLFMLVLLFSRFSCSHDLCCEVYIYKVQVKTVVENINHVCYFHWSVTLNVVRDDMKLHNCSLVF